MGKFRGKFSFLSFFFDRLSLSILRGKLLVNNFLAGIVRTSRIYMGDNPPLGRFFPGFGIHSWFTTPDADISAVDDHKFAIKPVFKVIKLSKLRSRFKEQERYEVPKKRYLSYTRLKQNPI